MGPLTSRLSIGMAGPGPCCFSAASDGDIASHLHQAGWIVVVVDTIGPVTCDVLVPETYGRIRKEVQDGVFDAVPRPGFVHLLVLHDLIRSSKKY